jgi:hypothetical protein
MPVNMAPGTGSEPEIQAPFSVRNGSENVDENKFKEGSLVEVISVVLYLFIPLFICFHAWLHFSNIFGDYWI